MPRARFQEYTVPALYSTYSTSLWYKCYQAGPISQLTTALVIAIWPGLCVMARRLLTTATLLCAIPSANACAPTVNPALISERVAAAAMRLQLPSQAAERVQEYVRLLLAYNERTNVYSKSAYDKLPFHIEDSMTLALLVGKEARHGSLDLGSGSGLPSLVIACVNPELPVWAIESKSRKTRFLAHAAKQLDLSLYTPLTREWRGPRSCTIPPCFLPVVTQLSRGRAHDCAENVNELSRSWVFDCDVVSAKAFKPLNEVGPIARRCVRDRARLLVPISEAQTHEFALGEEKLQRQGELIYYSEAIEPSHGVEQRKLITQESARLAKLTRRS